MADVKIVNRIGEDLNIATGLITDAYDYISLSPAAQPTTIIFKTGGSGGVTVATLTITYVGLDIATITKT